MKRILALITALLLLSTLVLAACENESGTESANDSLAESSSSEESKDTQGRVVLPPELLGYAAIDKNAVIIGVGDHLQIWSDKLWEEKENAIDTEALMEQLRQLGL